MAEYVKNYDEIRICAHAYGRNDGKTLSECDRVSLTYAVRMANGEWYTITTHTTESGEYQYARIFCHDRVKPTEKVVETPAELAEFFNSIKPKDTPSIALEETGHFFARWASVSPKGTIGVNYHQAAESYHKEIPLPMDGDIVEDASESWRGPEYRCTVFWNGSDAMASLWAKAVDGLARLKDFCRREKEREDRELTVGATRIDALLKFQEN